MAGVLGGTGKMEENEEEMEKWKEIIWVVEGDFGFWQLKIEPYFYVTFTFSDIGFWHHYSFFLKHLL